MGGSPQAARMLDIKLDMFLDGCSQAQAALMLDIKSDIPSDKILGIMQNYKIDLE